MNQGLKSTLTNGNYISEFNLINSTGMWIKDPTRLFDNTLNDINSFPVKKLE